MMPLCDQTGVPGFVGLTHFHSSMISGSAALMSRRTCSSVVPRQSVSSRILASIRLDAGSLGVAAFFARATGFLTGLFFMLGSNGDRSHSLAGQSAGLLYPIGELGFVNHVVLVDVEVAHFLLLRLAGRDRPQRRAAEEGHLDVL